MSHYDYEKSKEISKEDPPFASLIMAAGRKADSLNLFRLRTVFPGIIDELEKRYIASGGLLPEEIRKDKK